MLGRVCSPLFVTRERGRERDISVNPTLEQGYQVRFSFEKAQHRRALTFLGSLRAGLGEIFLGLTI